MERVSVTTRQYDLPARVRNEIISYTEMCLREGQRLRRGMNFGVGGTHSVLLMSLLPDAPYQDELLDNNTTLLYEGHDVPKSLRFPQPKLIDHPERLPSGELTENGKFHQAAQAYKNGQRLPERVRVYEKIKTGVWAYNGIFHLLDSWRVESGARIVFKFKLRAVIGEEDFAKPALRRPVRDWLIPPLVKLQVWLRDRGKCAHCGADDELRFGYSGAPPRRRGSLSRAENVQVLCVKHAL
jgi:hypothetical protein